MNGWPRLDCAEVSSDGGGTAVSLIFRRENGRVRRKRGKSGGVYGKTSTRETINGAAKKRERAQWRSE